MSKCRHKWGQVAVKYGDKIIPSAARMCVKCGLLKLGKHTVKLSNNELNMSGNPIRNVSDLHANRVYGTVYYSDIYFKDTECAVCGKKFNKGDKVTFEVNQVTPEHISLVPVHQDCRK